MALASVTFAVETRISFLAKVHGPSVLRHSQPFARNSQFQRTPGDSSRTGRGLDSSRFGMSPFGLRASSRVRPSRAVSVETPGRVQGAAAIVGFVFGTHR